MLPNLRKKYEEEVVPMLEKKFQYKNKMQVPKLQKITVNVCTSEALLNAKVLDAVSNDIATITGQKPSIRRARKAISSFKLRKGMPIASRVTLRRQKMFEFMDRLVNVAIPRVRDFKGLPKKSFDGRGNFSMGLKEQIIFPEIVYDKIDKTRGMNITIATTAKTDEEARELLTALGLPLRK